MRSDKQTDGRTDRQTYMTKLVVAFRNYANAPTSNYRLNDPAGAVLMTGLRESGLLVEDRDYSNET